MGRQTLVVVALCAVLAGALRIPFLGRQPIWMDEANCLAIARSSFREVWRSLEHDCSPPLYYWLLGLVAGPYPHEARDRALSAAFGVAGPPLLAWVGLRLAGPAGCVAGFMMALSPLHVWHSQEARMYSMVSLLGVALVWGVGRRRPGWVLPLTLSVLLWTHHFALFAATVVVLLALWQWPTRTVVRAGVVVAVAWAPAAWLLVRQAFVFRTGTWLPPPAVDAPVRSVALWLSGVEATHHSRVAGVPLAPVLALGSAALLVGRALAVPLGRRLTALWAGTLVLAGLVSRVIPSWVPGRYDVVVMPAFLVTLALGWARPGRVVRALTGAALAVAAALGVAHYMGGYQKSAVRDFVRVVEALERPGDILVVVPEPEAPVVHYYYRGHMPVVVPPSFERVIKVDYAHYHLRWADPEQARPLAERCWAMVPPKGRLFLLYSPYKETARFKGWLMRGAWYRRVERRVTGSGSLELAILARPPSGGEGA